MLMARPQYLEMLGWQETLSKSLGALRSEIRGHWQKAFNVMLSGF
jgi:hypothetical protein